MSERIVSNTKVDLVEPEDEENVNDEEQQNPKPQPQRRPAIKTRIPRFIKRNLPQYQSHNRPDIINRHARLYFGLSFVFHQDWFHVVLGWPTSFSVFVLLSVWTAFILLFALIYRAIDQRNPEISCGLGNTGDPPIVFGAAFAFSLETCTTVGYGLPGDTNSFFQNCPGLQLAIYLQMTWSMLFNAFLLSFFFSRLARTEARGVQVLFSKQAIVEKVDGKWLLHVRVYDLDSAQPVVEAHVRLYVISWRDYEEQKQNNIQPHLLHTLRILAPNDELGSVLFSSIPTAVTHHIDAYSPISPPHRKNRANVVNGNGLVLREVDSFTESRGGISCPVCGETYGSVENLKRHIAYNRLIEKTDEIPVEGSHQDVNVITPELTKPFELTEEDIRESLKDKEIVCVFEGIEPMISGTFQALQSYMADDIVFGGRFAPCMQQQKNWVVVDIEKFHEILPPSTDQQGKKEN
mmetsp:Transcript_10925/g.16883  ORF Transcript_10925/g.16883 Transcript_10925/m.16883 type:complete len:463 (+) Transcript_10925:212-1600(+)|eukprot:CAMPEP_0195295234 /NCGR_PEP_ID=MMETSP0707-20130614/16918_1 /TAXON_ID=33640 /ORGANISM="Asterionellopsis glacialis, Strain CCMP134" /LENGTH=462 /DNA_ID=CAMNT_0040356409 /DNA_START=162 /DNA_END=1550 /DNA_ORIENTATION=-